MDAFNVKDVKRQHRYSKPTSGWSLTVPKEQSWQVEIGYGYGMNSEPGAGGSMLLATERLSIPPSVVLIIHFGLFFIKLGFVVLFVWFVF